MPFSKSPVFHRLLSRMQHKLSQTFLVV
uniref:Uncharacterized protein n=1 Tax=Lotus japonicus TaxID=34305 RepID=I3SEM6_LOTJA|nr:unknown [Lotus japonicus]